MKYASVLTRVEILVDLHVAAEILPEILNSFELISAINKCGVEHDFTANVYEIVIRILKKVIN